MLDTITLGPARAWMDGAEVPVVEVDLDIVLGTDEEVDDGGTTGLGEDWWCIRTDPFHCPGQGCDFVANYMTAGHLVVVWPSQDDSALLGAAANAREAGRNPSVTRYRDEFGPAITWDEWVRNGQKVHGRADRPDGWESRPWKI